MTITPHVQWTTPAPLWTTFVNEADVELQTRFEQPSLLRFCSDDFMEELLNLLADDPGKLREFQAFPEVWQGPVDKDKPLKLFQPAHQRYYMVATNLVCRIPGLPDRVLSTTRREKTTFVVRRLKPINPDLVPKTAEDPDFLNYFEEYAFILENEGGSWKRLGHTSDLTSRDLQKNEEKFPLFGLSYQESSKIKRQLLTGLIPVGKYETYFGAQIIDETKVNDSEDTEENNLDEIDETNDPRMAYLHMQVVEPWRSLIILQKNTVKRLETDTTLNLVGFDDESEEYIQAQRELSDQKDQLARQIQMASWYILLDLADFLENYQIKEPILAGLRETDIQGSGLADALDVIIDYRDRLEGATIAFQPIIGSTLAYPPGINSEMAYHFIDNKVTLTAGWPKVSLTDAGIGNLVDEDDESTLISLIAKALISQPIISDTPALPLAAKQVALVNNVNINQETWFIIRCIFNRPSCVGQARIVVSEATDPFQLASFFDPEAPSRPVRISLPLDTSPAGLRKFSKNTAFVLSDVIACQIGQIQGITLGDLVLSVLPWPFHKSLPEPEPGACSDLSQSDGLVCSLSIPIVTICALVLLIIIVNVFDYFFRWIPYLMACFKLPGLKGKGKA